MKHTARRMQTAHSNSFIPSSLWQSLHRKNPQAPGWLALWPASYQPAFRESSVLLTPKRQWDTVHSPARNWLFV